MCGEALLTSDWLCPPLASRFGEVVVALAHHLVALWFLKCRVSFREELAPFIMKGLRAQLGGEAAEECSAETVHLQEELVASLGDLVSQCSQGSCGGNPRRSGAAAFLLEQGRTLTWLLPGPRLVTVTTSGCAGRSARRGLCDRCSLFCCQQGPRAPTAGGSLWPSMEDSAPPLPFVVAAKY